jgi:hypothetical protein
VQQVTAYRRAEIARIVTKMPPGQRLGMVAALTTFTGAADEPDAHVDTYL